MFLTDRQTHIVALAKSAGRVFVEELAGRFSVTPQTIRKDLNDLCDAAAAHPHPRRRRFSERNRKHRIRGSAARSQPTEKQAIGRSPPPD